MYIDIKDIDDKRIASYRWNDAEEKVELNPNTEDKKMIEILESILNEEDFFNPSTDEMIHDRCLDYFDGFIIKVVPLLMKYGFNYEIG